MYIDSGKLIMLPTKKAQNLEVVKTPEKFDNRELTRAIRDAIIAEEGAIKQYEVVADATDNEKVKKVLNDIANEEKVHVGELQTLLNDILPDEEKYLEDGKKEVAHSKSDLFKRSEVSEDIVPVEQIIGTSPKGLTEKQIDEEMHSKGYFLFREYYKWGKTLSYRNIRDDKVYLERDDQGIMVWMSQDQLKEQIRKDWRPASREDQDWFVANLGGQQ